MSIEAGVLIDLNYEPLHWHLPANRNGVSLPDSRPLWNIIWENRDRIVGFAHSHPGLGVPGPSYEDVTTFAAIEAALGVRLAWWIISADSLAEFRWIGPDRLKYQRSQDNQFYSWINQLRDFSLYSTNRR